MQTVGTSLTGYCDGVEESAFQEQVTGFVTHATVFTTHHACNGQGTLMIGDRLDTDIAGARASGLKAALVLTGATEAAQMKEAGALPDGVFGGLPDLLAAWTRAGR